MSTNNQNGSVLPEHIRASLAKHSEHEQLTCLECGYVGLMGVKQKTDRVSKAKFWTYMIIAVGILGFIDVVLTMKGSGILPLWLHIVVGALVAVFTAGSIKIYECPNCDSELKRK